MTKIHFGFWFIIFVTLVWIFYNLEYSKPTKTIREKVSSLDFYMDSNSSRLKGFQNITTNKGHKPLFIGRYVHPWNSSLQGLEFQLTESTRKLVRRLIEELESGKKVDDVSVGSYAKHFKAVTAVSSNHFSELMAHLETAAKFVRKANGTIVLYDLGLEPNQIKTIKKYRFVEYRKFNFSAYPKFVRNLKIYSWKVLIIQKIIAEFGGSLWFDSSIVFKKQINEILPYMVGKNSSFLFYTSLSGHSIVSTTTPRMFDYLPMRKENLPADMPQATAMLIFNTEIVRKNIMKWAIACCLLEDCISPPGSRRSCPSTIWNQRDKFRGCHRYDQSLFSIVVSNAYNLQYERYSLPKHLQVFADIWRVPNDWFFNDRKAIPYYVIVFLTLGILIMVIVLRKRIRQLAIRP